MSKAQCKKKDQLKIARLEIVSTLYKRGYSYRKIREEVMKRLDLSTYSLQTVQNDVQTLLREWRDSRLEDTDELVTLELARIDEACCGSNGRNRKNRTWAILHISLKSASSLKSVASFSACTLLKRKRSAAVSLSPLSSLRAA